jgi:hypothetical protein
MVSPVAWGFWQTGAEAGAQGSSFVKDEVLQVLGGSHLGGLRLKILETGH